jgi:hypothetical protein
VESNAANGDPKATMNRGIAHNKYRRNRLIKPFNKPESTMATIAAEH